LPEAVGLRRAREMSATGNFISAPTALEWGLVNHIVPHKELLGFARQLAADIASADPGTVREILTTYNKGALVTAGEAALIEARAHGRWHAGGIDATLVAGRRDAVIERGRAQG
jgi:enoyl-CoA hydratase